MKFVKIVDVSSFIYCYVDYSCCCHFCMSTLLIILCLKKKDSLGSKLLSKNKYMKDKIHILLNLIDFICIYCHKKYRTYSVIKQEFKTGGCAACHPAYNRGSASSEIKLGNIESYYKEVQLRQEKKEKSRKRAEA